MSESQETYLQEFGRRSARLAVEEKKWRVWRRRQLLIDRYERASWVICNTLIGLELAPRSFFTFVDEFRKNESSSQYIIKIYSKDQYGVKKHMRREDDIRIYFETSGKVSVCEGPSLVSDDEKILYKTSVRQFNLGPFGVGKVVPEKVAERTDNIMKAVFDGLLRRELIAPKHN